ncbi:amidohydrolase family protein [Algoriphagus sp. CAU 1675]|uniref:N-acetylglucosamine-6-phosphate deacetylase n=1 Tax=Algoriphagus sp. CAU 1675 TaxID=3032597 RepID=UPI0023DB9E5D|nr:amidohydrolase family protein [Algoriphagus sp. CAU 1675]MDF2157952.1 amidohydrolase family protein [Algoriphagus sp. CAU 1675]
MKLEGLSYKDRAPIAIQIEDGIIKSLSKSDRALPDTRLIGPGFTDIQVNGYARYDYNSLENDFMNLGQISRSLFKEGVTSHFPTVITNSPEQISKLIRQVIFLRNEDPLASLSIEGIHVEGPFISQEDGPRGAHPKEHVRAPNWDLIQKWQDEAEGLVKLITLSPEWPESNTVIEKCVENGIAVAIGHTNAKHQQIEDAVKAGARLSTHLGNGMHPILPRHPNYLWSQLSMDQLSATIIADGFHLPPEVIKVFKKVKCENLLLVSDSVSLAGMPPGDYDLHIGGQVTLSPEGKLHLRSNPKILAGSAMNLRQGVSFLLREKLANLPEAWEMASIRPERFINPQELIMESGGKADLIQVELTSDNQLKIIKTIKNGQEVYSLD